MNKAEAKRMFETIDVDDRTKRDYLYQIGHFLEFMETRDYDASCFLDFKKHLARQHDIAVSTKNKRLTTARIFLKQLWKHGALERDVTVGVRAFKRLKKHKRFGLTLEDVRKVSRVVGEIKSPRRRARLAAVLALLIFQGLRQVEVVRLDVQDIDLNDQTALIWGKGQDDKELIYLHPATVEALQNYFDIYTLKSGPLLFSESNRSRNQRLSRRSLSRMLRRLLDKAGIDKSAHGFRHFFTSQLVEKYQGNLLDVCSYTRHKSLDMLQVYYDRVRREADLPNYYQVFNRVGSLSF